MTGCSFAFEAFHSGFRLLQVFVQISFLISTLAPVKVDPTEADRTPQPTKYRSNMGNIEIQKRSVFAARNNVRKGVGAKNWIHTPPLSFPSEPKLKNQNISRLPPSTLPNSSVHNLSVSLIQQDNQCKSLLNCYPNLR
jgi:hypothetical protein